MDDEKHFNQQTDRYVVIATKVRPDFAETFQRICKKKGINTYTAIQMMVDTFVRYTDDRHNLSQEMEHMVTLFEHMDGWSEALNLADPEQELRIEEAVYLMSSEKRKGVRAVMVHRPYFGDWKDTATTNIQYIIERTIEALCPERYRRLRALAVEMDCSSILELIDLMIDRHTMEVLNEQYRAGFIDNNRHDFGKPVEYGQRTKRKHHKTVDSMQQQIKFNDPDDLEEEQGFRPHGGDW